MLNIMFKTIFITMTILLPTYLIPNAHASAAAIDASRESTMLTARYGLSEADSKAYSSGDTLVRQRIYRMYCDQARSAVRNYVEASQKVSQPVVRKTEDASQFILVHSAEYDELRRELLGNCIHTYRSLGRESRVRAKELLRQSATVSLHNNGPWKTLLHIICAKSRQSNLNDFAAIVINAGAPVDIPYDFEFAKTPLQIAVLTINYKLIRLLVECGANPDQIIPELNVSVREYAEAAAVRAIDQGLSGRILRNQRIAQEKDLIHEQLVPILQEKGLANLIHAYKGCDYFSFDPCA